MAARYGASLVIWGWYDRSRFRACFTVTESPFAYRDPAVFRADASVRGALYTAEDFSVFVNRELPRQVDYFVLFTLGQLSYWERDYARALAAIDQAIIASEAGGPVTFASKFGAFYLTSRTTTARRRSATSKRCGAR